MKKIVREITIKYFEDTDSGNINLVEIKPGDISSTASYKIDGTETVLYVNLDINNRIISFEIDGMGLALPREIIDDFEKIKDN